MELRKYPEAQLERKFPLYFNIGLLVALLFVITAFEWKFYDRTDQISLNGGDGEFEEIMDIPPTHQPPPPPPKLKNTQINIIEVDDVEEIEELEIDLDIEITEEMVIEDVPIMRMETEEEDVDEIFVIVEVKPEPVGGYSAFYTHIYESLHYPNNALRNHIEGRVFVQFVVDRDGTLTDFKVAKGLGAGCDEAAIEAVKTSPKWTPGKQRGRAVKVRMILPITFRIAS